MFKHIMTGCTLIMLVCLAQQAFAQKATEIFIPVGESPGLSGKYTVIGKVDTVNSLEHTITMSDSAGGYTIKITDSTQVWLDRSKLKLTNETGSFGDLEQGLRVEVKFLDNKKGSTVEWVKVQLNEQK